MKKNQATQDKVIALQKENRALDRAFFEVFEGGGASPMQRDMVLEYLNEAYLHRSMLKQDKEMRVDPLATVAANGAQNVVLDIRQRIRNGEKP